MAKYVLKCYTSWCGEDNSFGVITNNTESEEFLNACDMLAYDNFNSFSGFDAILEEMFPEVEGGEYTEEQEQEAAEVEGEYYGWNLEEYSEEVHGEWAWYGVEYQDSEE